MRLLKFKTSSFPSCRINLITTEITCGTYLTRFAQCSLHRLGDDPIHINLPITHHWKLILISWLQTDVHVTLGCRRKWILQDVYKGLCIRRSACMEDLLYHTLRSWTLIKGTSYRHILSTIFLHYWIICGQIITPWGKTLGTNESLSVSGETITAFITQILRMK